MSTLTDLPDFVTTLNAAIASDRKRDRPTAKEVVNALLQAEKAAKVQRITYPSTSLIGNWRLWFTAPRQAHLHRGTASSKGFYLPQIAPAQISFQTSTADLSQLEIANQIQCGSLVFKLTGPAKYLGKKNLLAFDFTRMQLCLFNRTIYSGSFRRGNLNRDFANQPIAELPFFAFFLICENLIAARGRGGGLAIWVKNQ